MTTLTDDILRKAFPTLTKARRDMVLAAIGPALARYDINTSRRIAAFLGQCHHESAGFTRTIESFAYSDKRLLQIFPKYFNTANLKAYSGNGKAIASRAYANRMGNGSEGTQDGWTYRGRAMIMITGKDNYSAFAGAMGMTLKDVVTYLETPEGAWMASAWWWSRANCNRLADGWEITALGGRINGMTPPHGNKERLALCNAALKAFG